MTRNLLRRKAATLGGEQETGFESAFANLAYQYIKDKVPRLIDYMLGFQLVDRNNDNTKAIGVFGFKAGPEWMYAPVFFLNGDLKGHELLYMKKRNQFVPLKENWINDVLSKRPHILGEPSEKKPSELGALLPLISRLSVPPRNNKYASAAPMADWAKLVLPSFAKFATQNPLRDAKYASMRGLPELLRENLAIVKGAWDRYGSDVGFRLGIDRFYGGAEMFSSALSDLRKKAVSLTPSLVQPVKIPTLRQAKAQTKKSILPKLAAADDKIDVVVDADDVITHNIDLNEEEREKLLRDPVLIRDHRNGEEVTKAYNVQIESQLQNPHETTRYDVLVRPGGFEQMLVIQNPYAGNGGKSFCVVVRLDGEKTWLNTHRTNVWTREAESFNEYKKWFDALPDKSELEVGGTYVALAGRDQGTCPFVVDKDLGDDNYRVNWKDYADGPKPRHEVACDQSRDPFLDYRPWDARVVINGREGSRIKTISGTMYLPESAKIVKIKDPPKPKKDDEYGPMPSCSSSDPAAIELSNIIDVQNEIVQKTARLKVYSDHHEVVLSTDRRGHERFSKTGALVALVKEFGLREDTAREILKTAGVKQAQVYRLVYGPGYPIEKRALRPGGVGGNILDASMTAPAQQEPEFATDNVYGSMVPHQYPMTSFDEVPGADMYMTDSRVYDPYESPDPELQMAMQEAATKGQKEVFDIAAFASMLNAVREDSIVDRYLPDLLKGLDRLGRILFMFYWHGEEFQDRYGKADMPEMEDSIRNAFESLGDVTLFLKEKSVNPMLDRATDPDIDDAARG